MPAQMIHLAIARNILKVVECYDHGLFYLGSISPDAIHKRENAGRTEKRITHLHNSDHKKWKKDAIKLLLDNKKSKYVSFYFGYVVHILSDISWLHEVYYSIQEKIKMDRSPIMNSKEIYYNDLTLADYEIYLKSKWKHEVFEILKRTDAPSDFALLSPDEITEWKNETIEQYNHDRTIRRPPLKHMQYEQIDKYINTATNSIVEIFK